MLTGKFLRNTGQYTGAAGQSKWIVQPCECTLCASGEFVYTDEPLHASLWSEGMQPNRHIAKENLFIVGQRDSRNA